MRDELSVTSMDPGEGGAAVVREAVGPPVVEPVEGPAVGVESAGASAVSDAPEHTREEGPDNSGDSSDASVGASAGGRGEGAAKVPSGADTAHEARALWGRGRLASVRACYERAPTVALAVVMVLSVVVTWTVGWYFLKAADLGVVAVPVLVVALAALVLPLGVAAYFARRLKNEPEAVGPVLLGVSTALASGALDCVVLLARFLCSLIGAM
ncbi:hypothetical protein ACFC1R_06605 [Kitasatospora sp. NPDC056138]|uniref:hypothetical protein n=1 Tax=Kitasatospora sp. NPDC056138 TaxID=3345724 RepID=UPI0035DF5E6C